MSDACQNTVSGTVLDTVIKNQYTNQNLLKNLLTHISSTIIVICCILACNTEKFRPKPGQVTEQVLVEEKPSLSIEEEKEQELIGAAQLDYSDLDESGNGIYGRQIADSFYAKLEKIKSEADPIHKGTLKIICCIDQLGAILMARPDIENTTMNDLTLQRKVGKILIDEQFEADATAPNRQCGIVVVEF